MNKKHELPLLKAAVRTLGNRGLDLRTRIGRALAGWQAELVAALGGADHVSPQQKELVAIAARTKLFLDSADAWLLAQPSLVDKRKRALLPVVRERQQFADSLARILTQLGLEHVW